MICVILLFACYKYDTIPVERYKRDFRASSSFIILNAEIWRWMSQFSFYCKGLNFIRAEGWVFAHIGDEGYTESCAAALTRYRRHIGADNILIFTDIKKKHRSVPCIAM